jgi:large subunit ribosomal protein L19
MTSLQSIERAAMRRDLPPFRTGDTVKVSVRIKEGDKQRTQIFQGVVLKKHNGGQSATFTVRKISNGVGVERVFPVESPNIEKIEIISRGFVRQSRLYYLRDLSGKKARLHSKVRDLSKLLAVEANETDTETDKD